MAVLNETEIESLRALAEQYVRSERIGANLGELLGAGASAAVFDMTAGKDRLALKVYSPSFFSTDGGPAELRRLRLQEQLIGHGCPNLVQLRGVTFFNTTCFVEMEHVEGNDLNKLLQDVPRLAIQPLVHQLVNAVRYLESVGLAHRDIKPHNIRVSNDFKTLKLLDLGVVRKLDHDAGPDGTAQGMKKPFIATAQYSSPEYLFWLHPPSKDLWRALSIYQVGAVLHDLITRRLLFADEVATENRYALAMAVLQKIPSTYADDVPTWLCALATRCLTKDMNRRLSMVRWDDFQSVSDRLANTVRRFQQIRTTGFSITDDGVGQHERSLRRSQMIGSVADALLKNVRTTFDGCQLERIEEQDGFSLVLRVPNTALRVDFFVEFKWSEIAPFDTAVVVTHGQLRPANVQYTCPKAIYDNCTLAATSVDPAVAALLARFVDQVETALDLAQLHGGTLSTVLSLEKSAP
jgi:serine/threonine protein kinase